MKTFSRICLLLLFVILLGLASASHAQDGGTLVPTGIPQETYYAAWPVTIKLDGVLSDWAKLPQVKVTGGYRGTKTAGEDESVTWAAAADDQNLYMMANVADITIISGKHGPDYWNEDSVEFYVNATDNLLMTSYKPGVVQLTIPTVNIGKPADQAIYAGVRGADAQPKSVMVKTATGYAVEVALPLKTSVWDIKPHHGGYIGFNVMMNGASEQNRNTKLMWSDKDQNDQSYINPSLFGMLIFYKVGEAQAPVIVFTPTPTPAPVMPVPVGKGSYSKTLPAGNEGPQPDIFKTANVKGAIPTNEWWSSLIWKRGVVNAASNEMYPHPLALVAESEGLGISYPTEETFKADAQQYQYAYKKDFTVGVAGMKVDATDVKVDGYSDWTVTAVWQDQLKMTAGHGLPFVYFTKGKGDLAITFVSAPTIRSNEGGIVRASIDGHEYAIFGPSGSTWTLNGNVLQSSLNGKDYVSVAVLPDEKDKTFADFKAHAYAFVTDTKATYKYDPKTATVTTTFTVTTQPKEGTETATIQALYRHQWLNTKAINTDYTYVSPRGEMKVLIGNTFETTLKYQGVLPYMPDVGTYDKEQMQSFVTDISSRTRFSSRQHLPGPNGEMDTYWTGKGIGREAQLVPIADQIGDAKSRDLFLDDLKKRLENWFTAEPGEGGTLFYYEPNWGAMIGYPAANFGYNNMLNDHNFHHGYFVMAASMVGLYDPEWIKQENWGGMVDLLIRDAADWDRSDTRFPYLRNFDAYAGHSWADGPNGSNQESSSEAMNFATGLILWGTETGNNDIRDLGITLYTTEAEAIDQYWFDVDQAVFPKDFKHTAVGILWANGGQYGTYFSPKPEDIHGINFLPFNAGSLYLGVNPDYVKRNYQEVLTEAGGTESEWIDILRMYAALADPTDALNRFKDWTYEPEWGLTHAQTYRWLTALQALGHVDTSVTADTPLYAVFDNNGKKTHVAFNAGAQDITVTFSDGTTLKVPPQKLITG